MLQGLKFHIRENLGQARRHFSAHLKGSSGRPIGVILMSSLASGCGHWCYILKFYEQGFSM